MFKMMLLHPNVATNARVVFKICSKLITTIAYHASKTWYIYKYTESFIQLSQTSSTAPCSNEKLNIQSAYAS